MQIKKISNIKTHKCTVETYSTGGDRGGGRGELPKAGSCLFLVSRPEGERIKGIENGEKIKSLISYRL